MERVDEADLRETIWMAVHLLRGRNAVSEDKQEVIASAVVEQLKKAGLEVYRTSRSVDWRDLST
jgi:hypothetical protein